jgi:hypothetical protein
MEKITQSGASLVGPKSARLDGTNGAAARPTAADVDALEKRFFELTLADLMGLRRFFELLDKWDREHYGTENL